MYLQKVKSRKPAFKKNQFFVGVLKANDENGRIRVRIHIHLSEAWIRGSGSGSTPKCHGSEHWFCGVGMIFSGPGIRIYPNVELCQL
jgi:hypothetical protein